MVCVGVVVVLFAILFVVMCVVAFREVPRGVGDVFCFLAMLVVVVVLVLVFVVRGF